MSGTQRNYASKVFFFFFFFFANSDHGKQGFIWKLYLPPDNSYPNKNFLGSFMFNSPVRVFLFVFAQCF